MKNKFITNLFKWILISWMFLSSVIFAQQNTNTRLTLVQKTNEVHLQSPTRPYFPIATNSSSIANADWVVTNFTEAQWLDMVPSQAPRSLQFSPANPDVTTWTWSYTSPNQIKDGNGIVFPNTTYPVLYATTTVMSGKIVRVPYNNTSKGWTFVQAQIDYHKFRYISTKLSYLSAGYYLTKNEKYARFMALAMDKLATVTPDYFMTQGWNVSKLVNVSEIAAYRNIGGFLQRASDHNGITYELDDNAVNAFDCLYESEALKTLSSQKGYDVRAHIENNLFLNEALWLKDQPSMEDHLSTNLPKYAENMLKVAAICSNATAKESIVNFVDQYLKLVISRNFKRDGMYPESFGYHVGYAKDILTTVNVMDSYFKLFPPTTPALTDIASRTANQIVFAKRASSVQDSVAFPNGDLAPFDDTHAGASVVRNSTSSYLLPAYQHAMLGDGVGNQQIQLNVGACDFANHIGSSILNMTLFANGNEQIGGVRYSRIPGRLFTRATQSHNLVVVDQANDQYYSNAQVYGNVGHAFTNGYFTLFEPLAKGVAATEVYSTSTKPGVVTRYQRLQLLNTTDLSTPYLIDVFLVKGGTTHDYFLSGSTQIGQSASASLPLTVINSTYPMLPSGQTYSDPVYETDKRNWYGALRQISSARSNGNWNVTFQDSIGGGVKIFAVDDAIPMVYLGKSPHAYRRTLMPDMYAYWRPVLIERRVGATSYTSSVFVHVIEPFGSVSGIQSVTKLPLTTNSSDYVALSIVFKNGRKDVALINMNNDLINGISPTQTIKSSDNQYSLTGKIGLFSTANSVVNGYLFQGSNLTYNTNKLDIANAVYSGTITGATRKADGATYDAFITTAVIPEGDELKGKWISVRFGAYSVISPPTGFSNQTNMNELFKIDGIRIVNGKTNIVCSEDHQLSINGTVTTELVRPQRVFNGATTFKIQKSAAAVLVNPTSVSEIEASTKVSIYPNPASDKIFISSESALQRVELFNSANILTKITGKLLGVKNVEINVNGLPLGVYICRVVLENGNVVLSKIIVTN